MSNNLTIRWAGNVPTVEFDGRNITEEIDDLTLHISADDPSRAEVTLHFLDVQVDFDGPVEVTEVEEVA